jgi:hypothetical protein
MLLVASPSISYPDAVDCVRTGLQMLEIAAIWVIVLATTMWFVRDERRLREERVRARARHFALSPAHRYTVPDEAPLPVPVPVPNRGLTSAQRRFMQSYLRR